MSRPAGTYAIFETSQGNIVVRLLENEAPKTVANFIGLAEGTKEFNERKDRPEGKEAFLRRIDLPSRDSAIHDQAAPRRAAGWAGPGYKFADEFHPSLKHSKAGKLSMANSGPGTNGSQFFLPSRRHRGWTTSTPSLAKSSRARRGRQNLECATRFERPPENTGVHQEASHRTHRLSGRHGNAHAERLLRFTIELIFVLLGFLVIWLGLARRIYVDRHSTALVDSSAWH